MAEHSGGERGGREGGEDSIIAGGGGLRRIVDGIADPMACHRGYVIAELDPATGRLSKLVESGPDPSFNGVSAAAIIGNALWIGSYQADRIAYRPLPSKFGKTRTAGP